MLGKCERKRKRKDIGEKRSREGQGRRLFKEKKEYWRKSLRVGNRQEIGLKEGVENKRERERERERERDKIR